jgi:uncharacterized protein
MRLYSGKIANIASESVKALIERKDIETGSPNEVDMDIQAVLSTYLREDQAASEKAKDLIAQRNLPQSDFGRLKRLAAEQRGIKVGDETLDYLLDQVVEMLLHSNNVDEVYGEDHQMRRCMAPIFKKHMSAEEDLEREVRSQLKHVKEGTSSWEIEYLKVKADIKRRKGL